MIGTKKISEQVDFNLTYNFTNEQIASGEDGVVYPFTGNYIACKYDKDWYIGVVEEVCVEERDLKVKFMHPKGPGRPEDSFYWPLTEDI